MKLRPLLASALILAIFGVGVVSLTQHHTEPVAVKSPVFGGTSPATFAEVDPTTKVVLRVLVIEQAELDTGRWGDPKNFVQTYTDRSLRKNYAGKGYSYDNTLDAFIPPKPSATAVFSSSTAQWSIPTTSVAVAATSTP